jgi:hypothetical protein
VTVREFIQRPTWDTARYSVGTDQEGPWDRLTYEGTHGADVSSTASPVYDLASNWATGDLEYELEDGTGTDGPDWDARVNDMTSTTHV